MKLINQNTKKLFTNKYLLFVLVILVVLLILKNMEQIPKYKKSNNNQNNKENNNQNIINSEGFQNNNNNKKFTLEQLKLDKDYTLEDLEEIGDKIGINYRTLGSNQTRNNKNNLNNNTRRKNELYKKIKEDLLDKIKLSNLLKKEEYKLWHLMELAEWLKLDVEKEFKVLFSKKKNIDKKKTLFYDYIKKKLLNDEYKKEKKKRKETNTKYNLLETKNKKIQKELNKYTDDIKKYNQAFTDYINYQKEQEKKISLLDVGKMAEDGIYSIFDLKNEGFQNNEENNININEYDNDVNDVDENDIDINDNNDNDNIEEGFDIFEGKFKNKNAREDFEDKKGKVSKSSNQGEEDDDNDLDDKLFKYLKYVANTVFAFVKKYYDNYGKNIFDIDKIMKDNNTMIGGGILFVIISMGLYFIDITS